MKAEIQEKGQENGEEGSKEEQRLEEVKAPVLGLDEQKRKEDSIVKEKVDIEKEMQASPESNAEED